MAQDQNIRVTADVSNAASGYDNLRKSNEAFNKTSRETINNLTQEIALLEKRNAIASSQKTIEARAGMKDALSTGRADVIFDAKERLKDVAQESREGKLQTQLMREQLDVMKGWTKEAKQNSADVQARLATKDVSEYDEKDKIQAQVLAEDEEKRRQRDGGGRRTAGYIGVGGQVARSKDEVDAGMAGAGGVASLAITSVPVLAAVAAALAIGSNVKEKYESYRRSQAQMSAVSGNEKWYGWGHNDEMNNMGYSMAVVMERANQMAKVRRSEQGAAPAAALSLMMERGIGLDAGLYGDVERLSTISGGTGYSNIQSSIAGMRSAGIVKGEDMSAVPDYLKIMVQLGQQQLATLGKVDIGLNTKMVTALASMDENLSKSPEALNTMISGVRGGLSGGNAQVEALQYSTLSKINPNGSLWDYEKMRADPFSNPEYLTEFLKAIKGNSNGNQQLFYKNISDIFTLSPQMAEMLGKGSDSGKISKSFLQDFSGKEGVENVGLRAIKNTYAMDASGARFDDTKINAGISSVTKVDKSIKTFEKSALDLAEAIGDWIGQYTDILKIEEKANEIKEKKRKAKGMNGG